MRKRTLFIRLFFIGFAAFLLYWSFRNIEDADWKHITYAVHHMDYGLVLLAIVIMILSHICRSERWILLIAADAPRRPTSSNAFWSLMVGYLVNMLVPRLGELTRCTLMSKYNHISNMLLIGTMLVERSFDFLCLLVLFALTVFVEFDTIYPYLAEVSFAFFTISLWYKLLGLTAVFVFLFFLFKWIITKSQRLRKLMQDLKVGILSIRRVKNKVAFIAYTILMWVLYVASIRVGFTLFEETAQLSWGAAIAVISVGSVAMIITQGGIGAYQVMVMELLLLYGLSYTMGFVVGWLFWLMPAMVAIVLGSIGYFILPMLNQKRP